jgi:hypothetical protein
MKLSLCVIVGNVETYIGRFLDHFQHVADEIVVVRAIGNQVPDNTLEIAKSRGCICDEYLNQHDFPHVDDFGAARNKSLDLATSDWLMWADTDDVISQDACQQIRDMIPKLGSDIQGVLIPYQVPDDGITLHRERVWRKGAARWKNRIHECLKFPEGAKMAKFDQVSILHMPIGKRKSSSDERNLRILKSIPDDEQTSALLFYRMQSERALGMTDDAMETAQKLAMASDAGQPERYEAFLVMGQMVPDASTRAQLYLQAIAVSPNRREAYAELAMEALKSNNFQSALDWSETMMSLSQPPAWWWNSRKKFYGWQGIQVRGMALRANHRADEANAIEANHFIRNGAKISLLHATRGRPAQAYSARAKWLDRAADPDAIEHIYALDYDDPMIGPFLTCRHVINRDAGPVGAWNAAARFSQGEILVQLSDDWEPPMHWDKLILDKFNGTQDPAVLAISDGSRNDDLLCMAILNRARYKQQGYMFHPEFFSVYSDNWFTNQAYNDGIVIDGKDITFTHMHPAFGLGEMDETYARSNAKRNYEFGKGTLHRLQSGIAVPSEITGWCDFKDFYRNLAMIIKDGSTFVEIGSWMGQSIVCLCQALQDLGKNCKIYCVDTFKGEQNQPSHLAIVDDLGGSIRHVFEENIRRAGVHDMIEIIEGDSAESADLFADDSIDAIYIDAAHDYDSVVKDVAAWFPKCKSDGLFSGHDYPCDDVKKAVDEHAELNDYKVAQIGRVWIKQNQ